MGPLIAVIDNHKTTKDQGGTPPSCANKIGSSMAARKGAMKKKEKEKAQLTPIIPILTKCLPKKVFESSLIFFDEIVRGSVISCT